MLVNGGRSAASFLLMFDIIALSKSCEHLLCIFNSAILILVELTSRHNILSDTVLLINLKKKCCSTSQVHQRSVRYNLVPWFWKHTTQTPIGITTCIFTIIYMVNTIIDDELEWSSRILVQLSVAVDTTPKHCHLFL